MRLHALKVLIGWLVCTRRRSMSVPATGCGSGIEHQLVRWPLHACVCLYCTGGLFCLRVSVCMQMREPSCRAAVAAGGEKKRGLPFAAQMPLCSLAEWPSALMGHLNKTADQLLTHMYGAIKRITTFWMVYFSCGGGGRVMTKMTYCFLLLYAPTCRCV